MPPNIIQPPEIEKSSTHTSLANFSGAQPGVIDVIAARNLDALVLLNTYQKLDNPGEREHVQETLNKRSWKNLCLTTLWDRLEVRARCLGLDPDNIGFIARSHAFPGYICTPSVFDKSRHRIGMTNAVVRDTQSESGFRDATLGEIGFEGIEGLRLEVFRRIGDNLTPSHLDKSGFSTSTILTLRNQLAALHKLGLATDDIQPGSEFDVSCARKEKWFARVDEKGDLLIWNKKEQKGLSVVFDIKDRLDGVTHATERSTFLEGDISRGTLPQDSFPVVLKDSIGRETLPILQMIRTQ